VIADLKSGDALADRFNDTGCFMPENNVAESGKTAIDNAKIRMAYATVTDFYAYFARSWFNDIDVIVNLNRPSNFLEYCRFHIRFPFA
jgi:hypothetical protein